MDHRPVAPTGFRRVLALVLSACIAAFSAGLAPYGAWAQIAAEAAVASRPGVSGAAAGAAVPGLGGGIGPQSVSRLGPGSLSSALQPVTRLQPSAPAEVSPNAVLQGLSLPIAAIAHSRTRPKVIDEVPGTGGITFSPAGKKGARPAAPTPFRRGPGTAVLRARRRTAAAVLVAVAKAASKDKGTRASGSEISLYRRMFDGSAKLGVPVIGRIGGAVSGLFRAGTAGTGLLRVHAATVDRASELPPPPGALSHGRTATGLSPPDLPGRLNAREYRVPLSIRVKRAFFLGAHYSLLSAALGLLIFGAGLLPTAIAAGALTAKAFWSWVAGPPIGSAANPVQPRDPEGMGEYELKELRERLLAMQRGESMSEEESAKVEAGSELLQEFLDWSEDTAESLVARLGLDPYRAPRVWLDEASDNLHFASSIGKALDKSGNVYMGLGFVLRPLDHAAGVLAHELGHLFFGDKGWLRDRVRMNENGERSLGYGMKVAGALALGAGALTVLINGAAILAGPASLALGAAAIGAALASAAAGLLFGLAATRQEELRADHFSAWLTRPAWLAAYLRDQDRGYGEGLLSTHPSFSRRVALLEAMGETEPAGPVPGLPASRSEHALNGSAELVVSGVDGGLESSLRQGLSKDFDVEVHPLEEAGRPTGRAVIRLVPKDAAYLAGGLEEKALAAAAPLLEAAGAALESVEARPHDIFTWAGQSPTAGRLMRSLREHPIPVRWDETLGPDGPRGALQIEGRERPEIVVNPYVFQKASPRALMSLIAHEAFHYEIYLEMRRIGIDWLHLGGMEFERLAHSIGARVWRELGSEPSDDIDDEFSPPGYESGFRRWAVMGRERHIDFLKDHGYGRFLRLRELMAMDPAAIQAQVGSEDDPEIIRRKLESLWKVYRSKSRRETLWSLRHGAHVLRARVRELRYGGPGGRHPGYPLE